MSGPSAARKRMRHSAPPKPALTSKPSKPTPRRRGSAPTTGRVSGRRLKRPAIMCWRAATGAILSSLTALGDDHSLARRLGMKAAELRAYMADLDPASLPSVDQAKAMQAAREAVREAAREAQEREQHGRAADGQGREDRPTSSGPQNAPQPDYAAAKGRRDDIRPDLASELQRAAQPVQEIGEVAENAIDTADRAATGMLGGAAKLVGRIAEALADMISPTPPPTKEQVQQQQRAEEAERPLRETARSKAEWEAWLQEQLQDDLRRRARHREEGYDRDDDGGRERERER